MRKIKYAIVFCMLILSMMVCNVGASTHYVNRGCTNAVVPHLLRDKIVTTKVSTSTSYGKWVKEGVLNNKNSKVKQSIGYSVSETNSRTFSLGAKVTKTILAQVVDMTIGGSLSYSKTKTFSGSSPVPAKKCAYVEIRQRTETVKYKHVVQRQWTDIKGKWKNRGGTSTSYSTVTTKIPELRIRIID